MRDIAGRFIKGHNYKGGLPKCKECGCQLADYRSLYCKLHALDHINRKDVSGVNNPFYGRKMSEENREKLRIIRCTLIGDKSPHWKGGITPLSKIIRNLPEMEQWRKSVFSKDKYTCQECRDSLGGNLNAHHIVAFKHIFTDFILAYNQFSPMEDRETLIRLAVTYYPFWDINNGQTLCEECHDKKSLGNPNWRKK